MTGLQVRHQGNAAEVRLQLRQGDGVVEASLRETARGVEIQLVAGPEHQPLLNRVAEALTVGHGDQGFDLDGVTVDTYGDPAQPRHQRPDPAPVPDTDGSPHRLPSRTEAPPRPSHLRRRSVGTSYLC